MTREGRGWADMGRLAGQTQMTHLWTYICQQSCVHAHATRPRHEPRHLHYILSCKVCLPSYAVPLLVD